MALLFKTSEQLNEELGRTGTMENLGILEEILPADCKLKFGKKNKMNKEKRLTLIVINKGGELAFLPCADTVNRIGRKFLADGHTDEEVIKWLSTLELIENEVGNFISLPLGEATEGISLAKVKKTKLAFNPEELIAF